MIHSLTMDNGTRSQKRNVRFGLVLGLLAVLYIAAVIAFIIVY